MKRFIIAILMLAFSLTFCAYSQVKFRNSLERVEECSQNIISNESDDNIQALTEKLVSSWNENKTFIEIIVSHNETNEIDVAVKQLSSLAENGENEQIYELNAEIYGNLVHLIESDKITPGNIF